MQWVFPYAEEHVISKKEEKMGHPARSTNESESLLERVTDGDAKAEVELYSLIGRCVRAKLTREFGTTCDDIHHDVYLTILESIRKNAIRDPGALLGYIWTVLLRRRSDLIEEKVNSRLKIDGLPESACPAPRADEIVESDSRRAVVRAALKRLPTVEQDLLNLFYYQDQPWEEIAEAKGISPNQFRLGKSRAIQRLRQHVETLNRPKVQAYLKNCPSIFFT